MDPVLWNYVVTIGIFGTMLAILSVYAFIYNRRHANQSEDEPSQNPRAPARGNRQRINVNDGPSGEFDELADFEEDDVVRNKDGKKIGTKKLAKLQQKEERRKALEAEKEYREEQKQKKAEKDALIKKKEEEKEALEKEKEEEEERLRAIKEQKEYEEYLALKEQFDIAEEGEIALTAEEEEKKLEEFIAFIQTKKVCMLEDIAINFNMKIQDVIDKVQELLSTEQLTGVIDDRGKFIFITPEELQKVADFIKARGRISIKDLALNSSRLINLSQTDECT